MTQNKNIDLNLLQKMISKGFTPYETAEFFGCSYQTIQYYARTRKLGKFKKYYEKNWDKELLRLANVEKLSIYRIAKNLNKTYAIVYNRYKTLTERDKNKKERYQWIKKYVIAKDVEEN